MKTTFLLTLILFLFGLNPASAADNWKEYRSSHFILYYDEAPEDFIKSVAETAENYYYEITKNLGFYRTESWSWDQRAQIYIYDDMDNYIENAKQATWSHGAAQAKDKIIRTFPAAHGFFDSTLPHELGHIIFREFVGFKSNIPIWMDEGVAMYQEKAKRWGANRLVKEAMDSEEFISIPELSEVKRLDSATPKGYVELFYAEAASIVYYLITEFGQYHFVQFCKYLKEGNRFDYALSKTYGRFETLEDLDKAWKDYLKRQ
ncbi:MAG: peptidase MA family metallohydrolase [Candidatus Omnitrophota bacterium]